MLTSTGYCAGGSPVLRLAKSADQISAAFIAHPTRTSEQLFSEVMIPVSVAFADNDRLIEKPQRDAAETGLLASGCPYQISLYSHVNHGFSCRRAFTTDAEVFAKKQAFIQAITWLEEHLREDLLRQRAAGDFSAV
jgi:dienelactone hydrolase